MKIIHVVKETSQFYGVLTEKYTLKYEDIDDERINVSFYLVDKHVVDSLSIISDIVVRFTNNQIRMLAKEADAYLLKQEHARLVQKQDDLIQTVIDFLKVKKVDGKNKIVLPEEHRAKVLEMLAQKTVLKEKLVISDIPKLTKCGDYRVTQEWDGLIHALHQYQKEMGACALDLNPEFQRGTCLDRGSAGQLRGI